MTNIENKREKFIRLAEKRTNAVLDKIRILGNCSNPYAYEYIDADVREIFSAIENELKIARAQFRTADTEGIFELSAHSEDHSTRWPEATG